VRYDNDTYYRNFGVNLSVRGHDTEWTLGARAGRTLANVQLLFDLAYSTRYNRGFVDLLNAGRNERDNNLSITLGGAWTPNIRRATETTQ
jgi:hypothetical protein